MTDCGLLPDFVLWGLYCSANGSMVALQCSTQKACHCVDGGIDGSPFNVSKALGVWPLPEDITCERRDFSVQQYRFGKRA